MDVDHAGRSRRVSRARQADGADRNLIDDHWAEFLKENNVLVGLSADGPEALHDAYRVDPRGEGARTGRNDPCPCGSGTEFKNCHGAPAADSGAD